MITTPQPIVTMDRDQYLSLVRNESEGDTSKPPLWSDARNELIAEQREDAEIAALRGAIIKLQTDLAIKEDELQALIVKTLSGESKDE